MERMKRLNKTLAILYIVIGSLFLLDAIANCIIVLYDPHAFYMLLIYLIAVCEVSMFVSSIVVGTLTLRKNNNQEPQNETKKKWEVNLLFKFIYSIAFSVSAIGWYIWYLKTALIPFLLFNYLALFIALLVLSIVGANKTKPKLKFIFNKICAIINIVISVLSFILLLSYSIYAGYFIGYLLGLIVFITIDVVIIVVSGIETKIANKEVKQIELDRSERY